MTREEAKTVFLNRGYVEVDNGTYYSPDKWREACVVISEWLDQEPCEDTISKQAVNILVDELARAISDERCCVSRGRSTATIIQDILDLPPVTKKTETVTEFADRCRECGAKYGKLSKQKRKMTREEKQKAIDALKISAPVVTITQEEFTDYIQTLNKIMDWLEQEPCDVPDTNDGKMSENSTGKDVIWYSKRNYSEIAVEPQERSEE